MRVPRGPDGVTAEWISGVVGRPVGTFSASVVGQDHGWGGTTVRVDVDDDVLAVKLAPADTARRESVFYRRFAPGTDLPLPRHLTSFDDGEDGVLVLGFVSGRQGDCFDGCSRVEAEELVRMLVELHATWWHSPALADAGGLLYERDLEPRPDVDARFLDRHRHELPTWYRTMFEGQQATIGREVDLLRRSRTTLAHGDVHADNLIFTNDGIVLVDWANAGHGPAEGDLAGLLTGAITSDQFRSFGTDLVDTYTDGMRGRGIDVTIDGVTRRLRAALQVTVRGLAGWLGGQTPHPPGSRKLELGRLTLQNLVAVVEAYPPV